jgi:phage FluMu protein Com
MPIEFRCTQCQNILRVGDEHAGGQARCPKCKAVQQIPLQTDPAGGFSSAPPSAPNSASGSMPTESAFPSVNDQSGPQKTPQQTPQPLFPQQPASQPQTQMPQPQSPQPQDSNPFSGSQQPQSPNPFGDVPQQGAYAAPMGSAPARSQHFSTEDAKRRVMGPAISMLVISILCTMPLGLMFFVLLVEVMDGQMREDDVVGCIMIFVMLVMEGIVAIGAFRMIYLKNYGLSMTAAIVCLLCGFGTCLQLGFGIWALVVLSDSYVRERFT